MTSDNSFASNKDIYPETALAHIEDSLSNDEIDIEYDSMVEQFHNLLRLLQQHAQQTTEQTVERDQGRRGTLVSNTMTDYAIQDNGQAAKFSHNSEDYLVEQRSRHLGSRRLRVLKQESEY